MESPEEEPPDNGSASLYASTAPADAIVNTVIDWDKRSVVMRASCVTHITRRHPEVLEHTSEILAVVRDPQLAFVTGQAALDPSGHREVACTLGAIPRYSSLYLVVPIEYGNEGNWIVSAFISRAIPSYERVLRWDMSRGTGSC